MGNSDEDEMKVKDETDETVTSREPALTENETVVQTAEPEERDRLLSLHEALRALRDRKVEAASQNDHDDVISHPDSIDNETDHDGHRPPFNSYVSAVAAAPPLVDLPPPPAMPIARGVIARARAVRDEANADLLSESAATTSDGLSSELSPGLSTAASSAVPVEKLPLYFAAIRLAPIAFFYGLASGIIGPVFLELLKSRVCHMELNYAMNTCIHLSDEGHSKENAAVIALTSHYSFLVMLVGSLPGVIFAVFTGSWSDHFGRKLPMMLPFCGMCLSSILLVVLSYIPTHPAILLLVPFTGASLGGWVIAAAAIFSYIGDYSSPKNLAIDLAVFDGIFGLSSNLGSLVGGVLYGLYGFVYPSALYGTLTLFTVLYVLLCIRDRRVLAREFNRRGCQALFSTQSVKENRDMLVKERTANTRRHIFVLLLCITAATACAGGHGSINQLFFETPPLSWTVKNFTIFSCISGVLTCLLMIGLIPLFKKLLGLKDTAIGIIGVTSAIFFYIVLSAAEQSWLAMVAHIVGALSGLQYVAARSLLSTLVDEDERGKMMSVAASIHALIPILGSFVFTEIFSASVGWWPGFPFALAALMMLPALAGFCYIDMQRRGVVYNENSETRYTKLT